MSGRIVRLAPALFPLLLALGTARASEQQTSGPSCPPELLGIWSTELPAEELFGFRVTLEQRAADGWRARIEVGGGAEETVPVWGAGERLRFQATIASLAFDGRLAADDSVSGFVPGAGSLTHVSLPRMEGVETPIWSGSWNLLGVPGDRFPFDLYVGTEGDGVTAGWFFFRDQRLPSLFGYGMRCEGDAVWVGEKNLALIFDGRFDRQADLLRMSVSGPGGSHPLTFRRLAVDPMMQASPRDAGRLRYVEHAPESSGDGWRTAAPSSVGLDPARVAELVEAVRRGELPFTHSVLVVRHGKLVVEEYFYGFDRDTWHDMRSASKTVASTLVGLAIDRGRLPDDGARVLDYFPRYRQLANWDPRKARITVKDLLTMSSGLDADDSRPDSPAAENSYQSQTREPDWMRIALDAPMIADPGSEPLYGGANPLLLGGVLREAAGEPVEWFAHRALFAPLGITAYRWVLDPTGLVYLGGGLYLRPRDMAKFGQLYIGGGTWNGRRVLSQEWIRRSTAKYRRLANVRDNNEYGYLWWHHAYRVGERTIHSIEARGNGGQYIFLVPELDLVAVITSGNFRNRELLHQPEEIFERFLLPAVAP